MNIFMDLSLTVEVGQAEKPGCNVFTWGSYYVYVFVFAPFPFSLCLFFFFVPFLLSLLPGWKIPTPEYYSIDLSTRPVIMSRSVWQLEGWWPSGFSRLFHYWHRKSAGAGNSVVSPTWLDSPGSFVKPFETPSTTWIWIFRLDWHGKHSSFLFGFLSGGKIYSEKGQTLYLPIQIDTFSNWSHSNVKVPFEYLLRIEDHHIKNL